MKKMQHKPRFIQTLLQNLNLSFTELFYLEEQPNDLNFVKMFQTVNDLRQSLIDVENYTRADNLTDAESEVRNSLYETQCIENYMEQLNETITQQNEAYRSLQELIVEIINKEDIDLRNYSSRITEQDWKIVKRQSRIDDVINDED